ncbi:hypothetical protein ACFL5O_05380 [Myxococcota bacterium]
MGHSRLFLVRGSLLTVGGVAIQAFACAVPDYRLTERSNGVTEGQVAAGQAGTVSHRSATHGGTRQRGGASPGGLSEHAAGGSAGQAGAGAGQTAEGDCSEDRQCTAYSSARHCHGASGRCVECLPDDDTCPAGTHCVEAFTCQLGCAATHDCPDGFACNSEDHRCEGECREETDCPPGAACKDGDTACSPGCTDSSTCPEGWTCCSAQCRNLAADPIHCGTCDTECAPANATAGCRDGECIIQECADGHRDCNRNEVDGCEANLLLDFDNCGECGRECPRPLICVAGACTSPECTDPQYANCNGDVLDGCETNLEADVENCGECGIACPGIYGRPTCSQGQCNIVCDADRGNCDDEGLTRTGCETDLQTSRQHCGECGRPCTNEHGDTLCEEGLCQPTCHVGFADCDHDVTNGCEQPIASDPNHCGACSVECDLPFAKVACDQGSCRITGCQDGYDDCDGDPANGCESQLATDPENCGACQNLCNSIGGTHTCVDSVCRLECGTGFADCNGHLSDGCEVATDSAASHCGSCDQDCPDENGTPYCDRGVCGISQCEEGYGNCNADGSDGCEANLRTDPYNCGKCGNACTLANGTSVCDSGQCAVGECEPEFADCNESYADGCETPLTTLTDCGTCGTVCDLPHASESCATGQCLVTVCEEPHADCNEDPSDGCEVATGTSAAHCGACDATCSNEKGTPSCTEGICHIACSPGYGDCDKNAGTGCEQSLGDDDHCGACNNQCVASHGTATCSEADCRVASCETGWGNCDNEYSNGCEVNTDTSLASCGGCGRVCSPAHGTPSCSQGACKIACDSGWGDCNDDAFSDGCETHLVDNAEHCGTCQNACGTATVCENNLCIDRPCLGLCSNPIVSSQAPKANPLGTDEACYETTASLSFFVCGNFSDRTLTINGVPVTCNDRSFSVLPAIRAQGYCIHATAGGYAYAYFESG